MSSLENHFSHSHTQLRKNSDKCARDSSDA